MFSVITSNLMDKIFLLAKNLSAVFLFYAELAQWLEQPPCKR